MVIASLISTQLQVFLKFRIADEVYVRLQQVRKK